MSSIHVRLTLWALSLQPNITSNLLLAVLTIWSINLMAIKRQKKFVSCVRTWNFSYYEYLQILPNNFFIFLWMIHSTGSAPSIQNIPANVFSENYHWLSGNGEWRYPVGQSVSHQFYENTIRHIISTVLGYYLMISIVLGYYWMISIVLGNYLMISIVLGYYLNI